MLDYRPLGGNPLLPGVTSDPPSDRAVLTEIASRLRATRQFGEVVESRDDLVDQAVMRPGNRLLLVPPEPRTIRVVPQPAITRKLRVVPYAIVIKVQDRDLAAAYQELDRLAAVVHNTLDAVEYTDYCIDTYCYVTDEGRQPSEPPVFVAGLTGQFGYVADSSVGLDGTP